MRRIAIVAALVVAVIVTVVSLGLPSVKASAEHWAVTSWVLDFAKRRSVALRAGSDPPPVSLDDPTRIRLGAAAFESNCRVCHGRPGEPMPEVPARMTPPPPDLPAQVARWTPQELHFLIAHGVKFTGMPAWPALERLDEVWALVAFVQRLPTMDREAYATLSGRDVGRDTTAAAAEATAAVANCRTCHTPDSSLVPRLERQTPEYLRAALDAYAGRQRHSGIMQPIAAALDETARAAVATALSRPPPVAAVAVNQLAASIVTTGDAARDIPACVECHGPTTRARDPRYPALAGQPEAYLTEQLTLFAEGRRGGSDYAPIMQAIAVRLRPAEMADAARLYSQMPGPDR